MAKKKAAPKNDKGFEESLWDSANRLRGSVESSEYKHVVLSLIFLKFVSDKFEERRTELIAEGKEQYTDLVEFYAMKNVFFLPETSRWSYIQQQAKQGDIAIKIDSALTAVEKSNASLKGALPDNYFSRLGLDFAAFSSCTRWHQHWELDCRCEPAFPSSGFSSLNQTQCVSQACRLL